MTPNTPPRSLERVLLLLLPAHHREAIAGDLQEAYAERATRKGRLLANRWYARQVLSLAPQRFTLAEHLLMGLTLFAILYGSWFGIMELVLRHPGYLGREAISGTILLQAVLTLLFLALPGVASLRFLVALGCLPLLYLVSLVVRGLVHGADIEGYVLLMAMCLASQSLLTAYVLRRRHSPGSLTSGA